MNWIKFKRRNTTKCKSFRAFHLTIIHHITILLHNLFLIYLPNSSNNINHIQAFQVKFIFFWVAKTSRKRPLLLYQTQMQSKINFIGQSGWWFNFGVLTYTSLHARWGFISPTPPSLILQTPWTLPENRQISLNVMMGKINPETLRIHNFIIKNILMNGGNTHNFIQDRLFKYLDQ